jgi:predicted Rossmann fold flavoprotein
VVSNPKFLYSAIYNFDNHQMIAYMESLGCKVKIERGNRVFPVSDHSADVIKAFSNELKKRQIQVVFQANVQKLFVENESIVGVKLENGKKIYGEAVCVATGGKSYPLTGSTGDGYMLAKATGHKIIPIKPALSAIEMKGHICGKLQGLSLKNINVKLMNGKKILYEEFGELMFTHFGMSGPVILSASSYLAKYGMFKEYQLQIDLKPALSMEQLDKRILREFEENQKKEFKNAVQRLFPSKLIPIMIELSNIDPYKRVHEISKEERLYFVRVIKEFNFQVKGLRGIEEAIVTQGGISTKEINPSTMESKRIKNLYFAGEVMDLDALTGGYNLQIAWSTGYLAGENMGGMKV